MGDVQPLDGCCSHQSVLFVKLLELCTRGLYVFLCLCYIYTSIKSFQGIKWGRLAGRHGAGLEVEAREKVGAGIQVVKGEAWAPV